MTADGSDRSFGAPRFDVVLRGYDRRQVDEHLSRLQRLMGRMRSDLDAARGKLGPPPAGGRAAADPAPPSRRPAAHGGERRRGDLHRPDARDPAVGGGGGRGDPEQGPRRRSGRRRTRRRPACRRPGGGGRRPANPRGPRAPARRRAGRAHAGARPAGRPAVGPDGADHRCRPRRAGRSGARWAPDSRCRVPRICSSPRPRATAAAAEAPAGRAATATGAFPAAVHGGTRRAGRGRSPPRRRSRPSRPWPSRRS